MSAVVAEYDEARTRFIFVRASVHFCLISVGRRLPIPAVFDRFWLLLRSIAEQQIPFYHKGVSRQYLPAGHPSTVHGRAAGACRPNTVESLETTPALYEVVRQVRSPFG